MTGFPGLQLLLIGQDEGEELRRLEATLRARGHILSRRPDPASALDAVRALNPRLILVDLGRSGSQGLELCEKLRTEGSAPPPLILALVPGESPPEPGPILEAGFDDILPFPLDPKDLDIRLAVAEARIHREEETNEVHLGRWSGYRELESLLGVLDEVFFSIDMITREPIWVSPAMAKVLGVPERELEDVMGERWTTVLLPPELRGSGKEAWEALQYGPASFEFELARPDGETRWVRTTLNPTPDPSGGLLHLDGLLTDLTVRRHVEDQLSARNLELFTLNRILELTLASPDLESALPDVLELILEATDFPTAFVTRLDTERDRLVLVGQRGMPIPPEGPVEIRLNETLGGIAVERRKPLAVEDARSHPRFRNDFLRRQKFRSYVAFPLVASDRVLGVLTLASAEIREISMRVLRLGESLANTLASFLERLDAEGALRDGEAQARRLAEDLQRANDELEAFAYSVSHDLRAPLRTMQGFAHALLREYGEAIPPEARDFARRIIASGKQSEELIRDLLAYSRMSFEEMELQDVDLKQVYRDAVEQVDGHIRERGARITAPGNFPRVLAHHTTLVQVLVNLLTNAMKFVPEDRTPEIHLRWEDREEEGTVRLWVEDNGPGIPRDQRERIFKAFERLEGGLGTEGTGIGLAIVRRGMQRVGGSVGVSSEEGEGSRFWLDIPKSQPRAWRPWLGRRGKGG